MSSAKTLATTVNLENNEYLFKATGSVLKFDGYLKVESVRIYVIKPTVSFPIFIPSYSFCAICIVLLEEKLRRFANRR